MRVSLAVVEAKEDEPDALQVPDDAGYPMALM